MPLRPHEPAPSPSPRSLLAMEGSVANGLRVACLARVARLARLALVAFAVPQLLGCSPSLTRPLVPVPVQSAQPGYAHALGLDFDVLCEVLEGRLRCYGSHPLTEYERDGWTAFGDGFSRVSIAGIGVCALRAGRVLCWGVDVDDYDHPQERVCTPQTFSELSGVREIAMTTDGGCVVTEDRAVRCWGSPSGDLDDAGVVRELLTDAHGVVVGPYMGCAISGGSLRCWGEVEGLGEALDLPAVGRTVPIPVPAPAQVVAGDGFACARAEDGQVFCWGYGEDGALGRVEVSGEPQPPRVVPGLRAVDLVASASSVCARTGDGRSFCWGANQSGQLGLGHTRPVTTPTHVPALDGALDVAMSDGIVCARMADGVLRCVGDVGAISVVQTSEVQRAVRLPGPSASHLALGPRSVCVATGGATRCYGQGGAYGRGHEEAAAGWTLGGEGDGAVMDVVAGPPHPCVRYADGRVRCERAGGSPVAMTGTLALAGDSGTACVVDATRRVQCWGRMQGDSAPTEVPGVADAAVLAVEGSRACVLRTDGGLVCWRLSGGDPDASAGPTSDLRDFQALALDSSRTCAVRRGGQLLCWDGTQPLAGTIEGVTQVARRGGQFLVVQGGQVRPVRVSSSEITLGPPVPGTRAVVQLAATARFACARDAAGEVTCWGSNAHSQFGRLPASVSLDWVPLASAELAPLAPAMLECGAAPEPYYDDGSDYDEDYDGDYDEEDFEGEP